jgi:hypothetical protein
MVGQNLADLRSRIVRQKSISTGNSVAATIEHAKFFSNVATMELVECPKSLSTVYPGFRKLHPGYLLRR